MQEGEFTGDGLSGLGVNAGNLDKLSKVTVQEKTVSAAYGDWLLSAKVNQPRIEGGPWWIAIEMTLAHRPEQKFVAAGFEPIPPAGGELPIGAIVNAAIRKAHDFMFREGKRQTDALAEGVDGLVSGLTPEATHAAFAGRLVVQTTIYSDGSEVTSITRWRG